MSRGSVHHALDRGMPGEGLLPALPPEHGAELVTHTVAPLKISSLLHWLSCQF